MDDNKDTNNKPAGSREPESKSAFPRRTAPSTPASPPEEKPIPSQPRSFSPVRPSRTPPPARRNLTSPTPADTRDSPDAKASPGAPVDPKKTTPEAPAPAAAPAKPAPATPDKKEPEATPASSAAPLPPTAPPAASAPASATPADAEPAASTESAGPAAAGAVGAAAASAAVAGAAASRPQSSGAGGDTIRLRVSPRPQARTLNTAPGRGLRRRLPDIRQGRATTSSAAHYGPFALMFGFLWLIFKMIFFTGLVLGLGALIGFMVMTEYIKTPEVTVPSVSGMKIDEAFEVLSEKKLGVIKRGTESSGLVAPDEIISQQPPAGATAKVDTDVGVIISSGRAQYMVPNVVNEIKENAINKIKGARLEVGNILTVEDVSVARGNVISQSPIGGTGQDEPVKVDLMVSAGPPGKSLTMPDLAGITVLEARAALKAVGIDDVITEPADAPADAKVINHDPLVGKTVFQTDKVILTTKKK